MRYEPTKVDKYGSLVVEITQLCSIHSLPKSVHKRLTRYSDESKNVLFCYDKCIEEDNEMYREMWREYYRGVL